MLMTKALGVRRHFRPGAVGGKNFQPARARLRQEYRQAAIVGVGARPYLARLRRSVLPGVVERAQRADRRVDEAIEIIFGQAKRRREQSHDSRRQILHRRVIGLPSPDEALRRVGPDRRGVAERERLGVGHSLGRARRAAVEALLEVWRRVDVARLGERFQLRSEIAIGIAGVGRSGALLLLGRQIEERLGLRPGRADDRFGDAVADYGEKPGRAADRVDFGGERELFPGARGFEAGEIEYRKNRASA